MTDLGDVDALTFDCYGTLIDWESGIWAAFQPLLEHNRARRERADVLAAFARAESTQQAATPGLPYPLILRRALEAAAADLGLSSTPALAEAFGFSVGDWPAFADSVDALTRLRRRCRLVILSNVDRASFAASNARLGVAFDAVYTAEDIGSYKPDPKNFEYLLEHLSPDLGVSPERVLHTAQSVFHDLVPASAAGLATAWIDRQGLAEGGEWGATMPVDDRPEPDFVFPSMAALADAFDAADAATPTQPPGADR